jgi:hypothetical protein
MWFWLHLFLASLLVLIYIKHTLAWRHTRKAIRRVYYDKNWIRLQTKYKPLNRYCYNIFHPLRWTYKQMFPGLEKDIKATERRKQEGTIDDRDDKQCKTKK